MRRDSELAVIFTKGETLDYIEAQRLDGSKVSTTFPKKGFFPHDAVHVVVERQFGYEKGFWGRVFAGATPEDVGAISKAGGHASSARAHEPTAEIIELIQSERIVECFEAELWSEPADEDTFRGVLSAACAQSKVALPAISREDIIEIRERLEAALRTWQGLSVGETLSLTWRL